MNQSHFQSSSQIFNSKDILQDHSAKHHDDDFINFDDDNHDNKYVCGCGKVYGSYPAFSTHRKTKHNNTTLPGTKVPKNQDPKRGRPSYEFKKLPSLQMTQKQYYNGLTSIELGLLELDEQHEGGIFRTHDSDFDLEVP